MAGRQGALASGPRSRGRGAAPRRRALPAAEGDAAARRARRPHRRLDHLDRRARRDPRGVRDHGLPGRGGRAALRRRLGGGGSTATRCPPAGDAAGRPLALATDEYDTIGVGAPRGRALRELPRRRAGAARREPLALELGRPGHRLRADAARRRTCPRLRGRQRALRHASTSTSPCCAADSRRPTSPRSTAGERTDGTRRLHGDPGRQLRRVAPHRRAPEPQPLSPAGRAIVRRRPPRRRLGRAPDAALRDASTRAARSCSAAPSRA